MTRQAWAVTGIVVGLCSTISTSAMAQATSQARLECVVTENSEKASGTIVVERQGIEVAKGSCGSALSVAPGSYRLLLRLDGVLDRPEQERSVTLVAGATKRVQVNFSTGVLEIQATEGGKKVAALATLYRDGKKIGSLGLGVSAHLSTGSYDVDLNYHGQHKRIKGVEIQSKQRRLVEVAF